MNKILKNKKIVATGIIALIFVFGASLHANIIKLPITHDIAPQWTSELETYEGTSEASSNIFIGRVIKKVGEKATYEYPETQFEVEVVDNIKGELKGNVTVSQLGGYKDGVLYRSVEDIVVTDGNKKLKDDGLIKSGDVYLFVTKYSEMGKWYSIYTHPKGSKLLGRGTDLSGDKLKQLYEEDEKVKAFVSVKQGQAVEESGKDSELQ